MSPAETRTLHSPEGCEGRWKGPSQDGDLPRNADTRPCSVGGVDGETQPNSHKAGQT